MTSALNFPGRRLISQEDAAVIEAANVPRSRFVGQWSRKTAFNAGLLVPFLIEEVLPGDHMSYDVMAYLRMATPLFPMLDNQRVDTFFFFVPNRLLWTNWPRFMGEQDTPGASIEYSIPVVTPPSGGWDVGSLADHFGIPINIAGNVNALPFRAYNLVWNKWFRDQNVWDEVFFSNINGPDDGDNYGVLSRAKSHDYFTSALPWPQKFTAPTVGIDGYIPVGGIAVKTGITPSSTSPNAYEVSGDVVSYSTYVATNNSAAQPVYIATDGNGVPAIYANLAEATGVQINTFRQAFLVQQLLERDARGGSRYVEIIRSHFGVVSPDFRLQRPEYIGGGQTPLVLTPVAQTAPSAENPVGALGAAGTSVGQHRASYAATEHGYILGLINVRSEISYQQGLHKMWSRSTRYDFYWPSLAGLGEQAILRKEIYWDGTANDNVVFGYQERWHEYRTRYSEVTGIMRSTATGTLDAWHLAQHFSTPPTLSSAFLADNPPMARVLAAGELADGQQYLADILIRRTATRPLPTFGTPATLGRF